MTNLASLRVASRRVKNKLEKVSAMLSHNGEISELNPLNFSIRKKPVQNSLEKVFVVLFNNGMIQEINPLNSITRHRLAQNFSRKSLLQCCANNGMIRRIRE